CSRDSSNSKPPWAPSSSQLPFSKGSLRKRTDYRTCRRVDACGHGRGKAARDQSSELADLLLKFVVVDRKNSNRRPKLYSEINGEVRIRADFLPCGGSLSVRTVRTLRTMRTVASP